MDPTIAEEMRETTVIDCLEQYGANKALHWRGFRYAPSPPVSLVVIHLNWTRDLHVRRNR